VSEIVSFTRRTWNNSRDNVVVRYFIGKLGGVEHGTRSALKESFIAK